MNSYRLKNQEDYQTVINLYEGNPLYLKTICGVIKEYFAGNIKEFINSEQPFLDNDLKAILQETLSNLSQPELQLLTLIAHQEDQVSVNQLKDLANSSHNVVINLVQSLTRRLLLLSQQKNEKVYLQISPLLQKYLTEMNN